MNKDDPEYIEAKSIYDAARRKDRMDWLTNQIENAYAVDDIIKRLRRDGYDDAANLIVTLMLHFEERS